MKLKIFAAALAALLGSPAIADAVLYECDIDARRARGWVSDKMAIIFDDKGTVRVVDGVLRHYVGVPTQARVRKTGDLVRLNWEIAGATDHVGQVIPTLSYTAKLDLKTLSVSVLAKPARFPERFTGKGHFLRRKNAKGFPKS